VIIVHPSYRKLSKSPACILSLLTTALIRGELKEAWSWTDAREGSTHRDQQAKTDSVVTKVDAGTSDENEVAQ
jgi:hypothetical protein